MTPRGAIGLLAIGVLIAAVAAQDDHITAAATPDRPSVTLSESVRVTLTITGPAPLRVEVPEKLLTPQSERTWEIQPEGPAKAERQGAREQWSQAFRLKPWRAGEKVPLAFAPFKAAAGTDLNPRAVAWPELAMAVDAGSWKKATPDDLEAARNRASVSGIEDLPPPTAVPPDRIGWLLVVGVTVVFAVAVLVALRRRRARPKPLPPHEWAAVQFDRLERDGTAGRELADQLAAVLREFVERRFGLPATRLTTAELIVEYARAGWSVDSTAELFSLLDRCDRAKFAGDEPDPPEGAELILRARAWVAVQSPASGNREVAGSS
jgi:hypothetical protein